MPFQLELEHSLFPSSDEKKATSIVDQAEGVRLVSLHGYGSEGSDIAQDKGSLG